MVAAPIQNSVQLSPAEVSQLSMDLKNAVKQVKEIWVLVYCHEKKRWSRKENSKYQRSNEKASYSKEWVRKVSKH